MALTKQSIDTLLDLVEIKLGCMEVYDREDARELSSLEGCRRELMALKHATRTPSKAMMFATRKSALNESRAKALA